MARVSQQEQDFLDDLARALCTRGRAVRQLERSLALRLHQPLWNAVTVFLDRGGAAAVGPTVADAAAAVKDRAGAISTLAARLLRRLPSGSVGDFVEGWSAAVLEARGVLQRLADDARRVIADSRQRPARRGRRPNIDRAILCEWVALQLSRHGIKPTLAKTGQFARVLLLVQQSVGYKRSTIASVERDVRQTLKDPVIADRVSKIAAESERNNS